MTGADRYTDATAMLRELHTNKDLSDEAKALLLAEAQVSATLALAAATALAVTYPVVGDCEDVTDWARLVQPGAMFGNRRVKAEEPEHWPPQPGDIWQDSKGTRWVCMCDKTLACLAFRADDTADEIRRLYGEMSLVYRGGQSEVECPF